MGGEGEYVLELGKWGFGCGPDCQCFPLSLQPFLPGQSIVPRPSRVCRDSPVLQPLEIPILISIAQWFDPCVHSEAKKLGGFLIKSDLITQSWQWVGDTDLGLISLMFSSLGQWSPTFWHPGTGAPMRL